MCALKKYIIGTKRTMIGYTFIRLYNTKSKKNYISNNKFHLKYILYSFHDFHSTFFFFFTYFNTRTYTLKIFSLLQYYNIINYNNEPFLVYIFFYNIKHANKTICNYSTLFSYLQHHYLKRLYRKSEHTSIFIIKHAQRIPLY